MQLMVYGYSNKGDDSDMAVICLLSAGATLKGKICSQTRQFFTVKGVRNVNQKWYRSVIVL